MSIINFIVTVPENTPDEEAVYITGNHDNLANWEPEGVSLELVDYKQYRIELEFSEGTYLEFKFNRGDWASSEAGDDFQPVPNRTMVVEGDEDVYLTVENWEDLLDVSQENTLTGNFRIHRNFYSKALGDTRAVMVYLPPGYGFEEDSYPVLYLHDGQNVFDASTSYGGVEWRVDEAAEKLIQEGRIKKIIMVAIYNDRDRDDEYTQTFDPEEGTGGKAEFYADFIINELKPFIDRHYRTLTSADDTAIMGSSLGGLCSLYLGWQYPDVFSTIGVISPSLWWDDRDIIKAIRDDDDFHGPSKIWLDIGTNEGDDEDGDDTTEAVENTRCLGEILLDKGYVLNENLFYCEVEGADHSEFAWSNRIEEILLFLFGN